MAMASPSQKWQPYDSSLSGVLSHVRSGLASSRAELSRSTGLSPTTVALRVDALITKGYLREAGSGTSHGGRRPRQLEVNPGAGVVGGVDLGAQHASFALFDMAGGLVAEHHSEMNIADGPDHILRWIIDETDRMAAIRAAGKELRGLCLGLPGPVDFITGCLVSPSRMPGWNGVDVAGKLEQLRGIPTLVDNDANLMALGEFVSTGDAKHLVFVKAGSSIGCGVIASGALHHGHRGMAGDISHVAVPDAPQVLCSCGRMGCLDAVAGGAAIVANLREAGLDVTGTADVLALAQDAHPQATRMLREAGTRTGGVLATIINFFNPQRLVLGGNLSQADAFVAGVRSAIYTECLPIATDQLEITVSLARSRAGVIGAGKIILDHLFEASEMTARIR